MRVCLYACVNACVRACVRLRVYARAFNVFAWIRGSSARIRRFSFFFIYRSRRNRAINEQDPPFPIKKRNPSITSPPLPRSLLSFPPPANACCLPPSLPLLSAFLRFGRCAPIKPTTEKPSGNPISRRIPIFLDRSKKLRAPFHALLVITRIFCEESPRFLRGWMLLIKWKGIEGGRRIIFYRLLAKTKQKWRPPRPPAPSLFSLSLHSLFLPAPSPRLSREKSPRNIYIYIYTIIQIFYRANVFCGWLFGVAEAK